MRVMPTAKTRKAQGSVEIIIVLAIALAVLVTIFAVNSDVMSFVNTKFKFSKAKAAVDDIGDAAQLVYNQGAGSKTRVYISLPSSVANFTAVNKTINIEFGGTSEGVHRNLGFGISGNLPINEGSYWICVQMQENNTCMIEECPAANTSLSSLCGNNVIEGSEECDLGNNNGVECSPPDAGTCIYCSTSCTNLTASSSICPISISLYEPSVDSTFETSRFNNFIVNVSCSDDCDCGNINVSLDPCVNYNSEIHGVHQLVLRYPESNMCDGVIETEYYIVNVSEGTEMMQAKIKANYDETLLLNATSGAGIWGRSFIRANVNSLADGVYNISLCCNASAPMPLTSVEFDFFQGAEILTPLDKSTYCAERSQSACPSCIGGEQSTIFMDKGGLVSTTLGAQPFYTTSDNPVLINLSAGQSQLVNFSLNSTGLVGTTYEFYAFANLTYNESISNISETINISIGPETAAPGTVSALQAASQDTTWIYWTWTNPSDPDFDSALVFLDGEYQTSTTGSFFNATGLTPNSSYTITVQTEDTNFNINNTNVSSTATTGYSLTFATQVVQIQSCNAESNSTKGAFGINCSGIYPAGCGASGDRLGCEDWLNESMTAAKISGTKYYGGINISAFNDSTTDCTAISSVELCYDWSQNAVLEDCNVSVDSSGGTSFSEVSDDCPSTSRSLECQDITSAEPWSCSSFFGATGTRALAKSEARRTSSTGTTNIYWDSLFFNVTYQNN